MSSKRPRPTERFEFPVNLEIPESALKDNKFLTSYVYVLNDPRVFKRRRMNGDRTSSRFGVDYNYHINVVYNEPVVKRKSILASPKEKNPGDSVTRKSVSFLSKVTIIDSIDLDGASSDWTDVEMDERVEKTKSKTKSKASKEVKVGKNLKKGAAASNDIPSSKNRKKAGKTKPTNKNGRKVKSATKELFKFKITKPLSIKSRKYGRSKAKKLKQLQKKFGKRMFKAFVHVKRSSNLKTIPDKVAVPLEEITSKTIDETTSENCVPSIQDFLIGPPVQGNTGDTNEEAIANESGITESASTSEIINNTTNVDQSDNPVDSPEANEDPGTKEEHAMHQNFTVVPSAESSHTQQANKINGDLVSTETNDDSPHPHPDVGIDNFY